MESHLTFFASHLLGVVYGSYYYTSHVYVELAHQDAQQTETERRRAYVHDAKILVALNIIHRATTRDTSGALPTCTRRICTWGRGR